MSSSRSRKSCTPGNEEPWTLVIGEIGAPHGLHGEVRVRPHTDFPERFALLREVGVQRNQGTVCIMKVTAAHAAGPRIRLKLEGIATVEEAEGLRGARLVIPESWAVELGKDEYYHHQLLGLEVVTVTGESLGPIAEIWRTGANDVYETPLAMIPATKDIIREVDLASRRMVVDARPGLKKDEPGL